MRSLVVFWALLNIGVSQVHANINLGTQLQKSRFIVRAGPENAISGKIKRERWSERKISIFYEPFPLLPPGSLWLGTSNHIPSSLIPFSKNVIRKSPFGLSIAHSLPVWAQQRCLTPSRASQPLQSDLPLLVVPSVLGKATHVLSIHVANDCQCACLSVALALHSIQVKHTLYSFQQLSSAPHVRPRSK